MKKWLCLLLCLLLLTGCGAAAEEENWPLVVVDGERADGNVSVDSTASMEPVEADGEARYLAYETLALPGGIECALGQCVLGDRVYVGGQTRDGEALAWTDLDGRGETLALPEAVEHIYALCPTAAGFALLGGSAPYSYLDWRGALVTTENPRGELWVVSYDAEGTMIGSVALQERYPDPAMNFQQLLAAEDGFYLLCPTLLVKIGMDGAELGRAEADGTVFRSAVLRDGGLYVLTGDRYGVEQDYKLLCLDSGTLETRNTYVLQCERISGLGLTEDGEILMNDTSGGQSALGTFDLETCGFESLFDWDALGISVTADGIASWDQGYAFFSRYEEEISMLRWRSGQRPERVTLQMAVTGGNKIEQLAQEFNISQDAWLIEVTTYGEIQNSDQALDVLRTEILAGSPPDLYCFSDYGTGSGVETGGVDLAVYGLDLTPYLDGDGVYGRDGFVPAALEAVEREGRLCALPLAFSIQTFKAPSALIPEPGITFEELEDVREKAGSDWLPFGAWTEPGLLLAWTAPFAVGNYVDWDAGTCRFDTAAFADYLTWCKTWAGDGSMGSPDDQILLTLCTILSTEEVAYGEKADYTYAGIPVESGYGSMLNLSVELGISGQTAYPDGAWAFLRYCLSRQGDGVLIGLPVLQAAIDDQVEWYLSGEAVDWRGNPEVALQENVDKFYDLLRNTTVLAGDDQVLLGILTEEAEFFFGGSRSAEETAAIIQDRASLYLMEKYG